MEFVYYTRTSVEPKSSKPSITKHEEPMSIKQLLERAERGIVDLSVMMKDGASDYKDAPSDDCFDEFSAQDRQFGAAFEDFEEDGERLIELAKYKKSKSKNDKAPDEEIKFDEEAAK